MSGGGLGMSDGCGRGSSGLDDAPGGGDEVCLLTLGNAFSRWKVGIPT